MRTSHCLRRTIDRASSPIEPTRARSSKMFSRPLDGHAYPEVWMSGSLLALLPRYRETLVSHDKRNAIYVPEGYNVNL